MEKFNFASLRFSEKDIRRYLDQHELSRVIEYPKDDENLELNELLLKGPRHLARAIYARWNHNDPVNEVPPRVEIEIQGKERPIYRFRFSTLIYHSMIHTQLLPQSEKALPPTLYSYRPKRSNIQAVKKLRSQSRDLAARANAKGLYFFKGDIRKYSDNINPNHPGLQLALAQSLQLDAPSLQRLTQMVSASPQRGLYVGSPLANIFQNFYLLPLDRAAHVQQAKSFYGRFNDDFLFVTPDLDAFEKFRISVGEITAQLGLELNSDKSIWGEWNTNGISKNPHLKAHQCFDWLGYSVSRLTPLSCSSDHFTNFRRDFLFRLRNVRRAEAANFGLEAWIELGNQLVMPTSDLRCQSADNILQRTDCRKTLRALDLWIAAELAKVAGPLLKLPRAQLQPRALFAGGLYSFVAGKNRLALRL